MAPSKVLAVQSYLSLQDIADYTGHNINTLKSLVRRDKFPHQDAEIGQGAHQRKAVGWKRSTVDRWLNGYNADT